MMITYLDAETFNNTLSISAAIDALRESLTQGQPDISAPARTAVQAPGGHVLIMPSVDENNFGIKIAGVAPHNPARGLPRITGTYLLHDGQTLEPMLAIDGPALTLRRTAALSALAVDSMCPRSTARLLIFGTGPQATAHIEAVRAVRECSSVAVIGRTARSSENFANTHGIDVGSTEDLEQADIVMCCTSSTTPLFDSQRLRPDALVIAMGAHTPDARELDRGTFSQAQIVVEDPATSLREAADVIDATQAEPRTLIALHEVVSGKTLLDPKRRRVFRSVGMAWEDLVTAQAALRRRPLLTKATSTAALRPNARALTDS